LFVDDAIIGVGLGKFGPGCQCQEPIWLNFILKTSYKMIV